MPVAMVIPAAARADVRKHAIPAASGRMRMARMTPITTGSYPRSRVRSAVDSDSARA